LILRTRAEAFAAGNSTPDDFSKLNRSHASRRTAGDTFELTGNP